jgi:hypothetical protein
MKIALDAQLYPPAMAYEQPAVVPHALDTTTSSIAELLANPAAMAIVQRELPGFESQVTGEALKPHLDNFSMRSLVQFGLFKPTDLDRIDAQLRALPKTGVMQ